MGLLSPVAPQKKPRGHASQSSSVARFVRFPIVPTGHFGMVAFVPRGQKFPSGQSATSVRPSAPQKCPAGQTAQAAACVAFVYVPGVHMSGAGEPSGQ